MRCRVLSKALEMRTHVSIGAWGEKNEMSCPQEANVLYIGKAFVILKK